MAGRKPRGPDPVPPPLGGIVIDGANVVASSRVRPLERLDLVVAWCAAWRRDLGIQVFVDHATAVRMKPPAQAVLRARCEDVTPGRARYAVCPRHEAADEHVLRHAHDHRALVVSNDRFFDHDALRRGVLTVQFTIVGDELAVFDEATWFLATGAAVRVPMVVLREAGRVD
ncbi:MAG: hypothetical protein IT455_06370 [Planctomycetes bacterium]|nr:hypothetical protein [Planctomycetota bacterium]